MRFDWNAFKNEYNDIAVHCKTREEARDFCKKMHEHGMKWSTGDCYFLNTKWDTYEKNTHYGNDGKYGTSYSYNSEKGYTILEWSDYMNDDFTKADLKYGYLAVLRNGCKAIYMPSKEYDGFDYMKNGS